MDPDAALEAAVTAYEQWNPEIAPGDDVDNDALLIEAVQRFADLHNWIVEGGFLPTAWKEP